MSGHRRILDAAPRGAEGRSLTQSVNCEFSSLDRNGFVSLSYSGHETIRYQTLPMRSQISDYPTKAALPGARTLAALTTLGNRPVCPTLRIF